MFINQKVQLRRVTTSRHPGKGFSKAFILCLFLIVTYFSYIAACNDGENLLMTFCLKTTLRRDAHISLKGVFPCQRITTPQSLSEKNARFVRIVTALFTAVLALLWFYCLLLCCGDIEPNPGPSSSSLSSSLSSLSSASLLPYDSHLSICHLNIQSLLPKIDVLQYEIQPFDIFVFTETWLNNEINSHDLKITNYSVPYRYDRTDRAGGVAIYVKDNLACKRRPDLEIQDLECVWLQARSHGHNILVAGIYRPPNAGPNYWTLIQESIDRARNTNINDIVILGDLNNDLLIPQRCKHLKDVISNFNLKQLIEEPTHFTEYSSSLIDIIMVTNSNNVVASEVCDPFIPNMVRYHCPIAAILKFLKPQFKTFQRKIWKYDLGDYNKYRYLLRKSGLNDVVSNTDGNMDSIVDIISSNILDAAAKSIPNKLVTIRPLDPPWMHNEIRKLIRQRKRLHRQAKVTNNASKWAKFRRLRNKITNKIRSAKHNYEMGIAERLKNNTTDVKTWWKLSKQILNIDTNKEMIPPITYNDTVYDDNLDKAEIFNSFFIHQTQLSGVPPLLPEVINPQYPALESITITPIEVKDVLRNLNVTKASGPDLMSPRLLKEAANELCTPLSVFFNRLIQEGRFPLAWKLSNVVPVHKKDDQNIPDNYRPISLLSNLGKSMEKCVHKHVYNYCITNNIISPLQSGFVHGDSTTYQLLDLYNTFCEAVDSGKEVRVVFCDISKAFDRVWHDGLLHKLSCIGISGKLLNWFQDYLTDRKQRVVINGFASGFKPVIAGVPQGSILGPLLFLIYINDIVRTLNCNVRLFADDTSLYVVVESPATAANILNDNLTNVHNWADQWLVSFNPSKTESMVISRKRNKPLHPRLLMDNILVNEVDKHKHLGIVFSNDCNWHVHIVAIANKAWQRINILRAFKFKLDRNSLERMYFSFIRPVLEYSGTVWDNCSNEDKKYIESIQIEAMRIVTGATKLCSIAKLYEDTRWETLQVRRNRQKLIIFYKMIYGLAPSYLNNLVPPLVQETSRYSLRNAQNVSPVYGNTNLYLNSFLPSVIRDWNVLPEEIRNSDSLLSFKLKLVGQRIKPPPYYNYGERKAQILHTRLRLECSILSSHLYKRNIIDSPLCSCGAIETTKHFFISCPNYNRLRNQYLAEMTHLPIRTLLCGNSELSVTENENIFRAVHTYIVRSDRFSPRT